MRAQSSMKIALLPGDGIGQEIMEQAKKVLTVLKSKGLDIVVEEASIGGAGFDEWGKPLPDTTLSLAEAADAILLGAVGGPKYDDLERKFRPEQGLLEIRKKLDLFANLRPAIVHNELVEASSLKPDLVAGLDVMIVRELTGDIYFGEPRGCRQNAEGIDEGFDTMKYNETEITRIAKIGFEIASKRDGKLCSVDKANVLDTSILWRKVVSDVGESYPTVELSHMYVDNAAMQLVREPGQFDVILTGNMFGDILSDEASMLTGSIGMLPSASLDKSGKGMYEPVHGSAPDIAGKNLANPLATILSLGMMFKYTFGLGEIAENVTKSVERVLTKGYRTQDIYQPQKVKIGTAEIGDLVAKELGKL